MQNAEIVTGENRSQGGHPWAEQVVHSNAPEVEEVVATGYFSDERSNTAFAARGRGLRRSHGESPARCI